ncbi:S-adenosylmethionine-binding domain-containing protein [Candidatus Bathyarchaeota archaeon]|nr:S-adenosylmethionine-binding domain-containing protein [Candidatus Bathyarchaeota archaeon]
MARRKGALVAKGGGNTPLFPPVSWRQVERETGRHHKDLKRWYGLYSQYETLEEYIQKHGRPQAEAWARKILGPRTLELTEIPPLPEGKFAIIYADPPWQYEFSKSESRSIEAHYSTLTRDQICSLKIPTNEDAVLFLWSPAPKIE